MNTKQMFRVTDLYSAKLRVCLRTVTVIFRRSDDMNHFTSARGIMVQFAQPNWRAMYIMMGYNAPKTRCECVCLHTRTPRVYTHIHKHTFCVYFVQTTAREQTNAIAISLRARARALRCHQKPLTQIDRRERETETSSKTRRDNGSEKHDKNAHTHSDSDCVSFPALRESRAMSQTDVTGGLCARFPSVQGTVTTNRIRTHAQTA